MAISDDYKAQVDQFRSDLPKYNQMLKNSAANQIRNQYQDQAEQIRSNANKRGLLYSGLKTGAEADTKAGLSGQLANQYANINEGLNNQANSMEEALLNRNLNTYGSDVNSALQQYGLETQKRNAQQGLIGSILGTGIGAAGLGIALSDENEKEDIKAPEAAQIDELLESIKPKTYEYKDEKFGQGKHLSPMAQDLEKSEIGKSMVMDTEHGKMVNYGKGMGAIMAIQSALNKRLKALEAKA